MKQALFNHFFENKKRRVVVFAVIIAVIIGAVILFSDYGLIKLFNLQYQKAELDEKIAIEYQKRDSLNIKIKSMLKDTNEIERIARDKYGLIKTGEEIIIIKKNSKK